MRFAIALVLLGAAAPAIAQSFQFHGFMNARAIRVRSDKPGWVDGGRGRFDVGGDRTVNLLSAQLGLEWTPTTWLLIHADGLARTSRATGTLGRKAGVVQAYVDLFNEHWRLRAGHFWLPTSRENIDPLWNSRYTITFSALNTWIGEEVRPLGADLQYSPNFYLALGATVLRDNDTMGTLLANRGWALGNRLSVYDEVVAAGAESTRPFGHDIDGRNGYAERIRVQIPERASLQVMHLDNNAEIGISDAPNEPWHTRYNTAGVTIGTQSSTTLAAEWASGNTTVGFTGGSFQLGFDTAYVLVSHKSGPNRVSARIERYATDADHGHAVTGAIFHDFSPQARAGVEYVHASGASGGSTLTVELRYSF